MNIYLIRYRLNDSIGNTYEVHVVAKSIQAALEEFSTRQVIFAEKIGSNVVIKN